MTTDRTSKIELDGKEYELLLTTKAVSEIGKRFGGLDKIEEKLSEDYSTAIENVCFLIAALANGTIARKNRENPQNAQSQLTADDVMELTMPFEIEGYKDAITECFNKGMKREVYSQEEKSLAKNAQTE